MPTVSRTFTVTAAPNQVIDYLADFAHAEEWDPGTVRCTRIGAGPVQVGSRWHNESRIAGISTELTYTLEKLTGDRIVFVGRNDTATSTETITVTPIGPATELTYTNRVDLNGAAKLASLLFKIVFERLAVDTQKKLSDVLDALPAPGQ